MRYKTTTILFCSILITSCDSGSNDKKETLQPIDVVKAKAELYADLYRERYPVGSFYLKDDCDSLLFSGLLCASGEYNSITDYRDSSGKWFDSFRTPAKTCYKDGRSGSEISRDMLVGAMFCLWAHGKTSDLEHLRDYGKRTNWIMGQGSIDRTYFTPNFQDTLYRLVDKEYKGPPYKWVDPRKDHQRHVVALNIILRGEHEGSITDDMLALLEKFTAEEPHNALFQYGRARFSDGNQSETINILVNNRWFPTDKLPTTKERCGRWLWERSNSHENWQACDNDTEHSGGDLLFVAWLLDKSKALY